MYAFGRKAQLYAILQGARAPFVPQSFAIPAELSDLRLELDALSAAEAGIDTEPVLWVVKPSRGGGGRQIYVSGVVKCLY